MKINSYEYRKSLPSFNEWKKQKAIATAKWYEKNKDKLKIKNRNYFHETIDNVKLKNKRSQRFKEWYEKNKDHQKKNSLRSYYKNKDKCLLRNRTKYYREHLLTYFGNRCMKCGSIDNLEFHHTSYPKIERGSDGLNKLKKILLLLCRDCHKRIHRK